MEPNKGLLLPQTPDFCQEENARGKAEHNRLVLGPGSNAMAVTASPISGSRNTDTMIP